MEEITIDLLLLRSHLIRFIRKTKVEWVSSKLGRSQTFISYKISGKRRFSLLLVHQLCSLMEKPIETYVLGSEENIAARRHENAIGFERKLRPSSHLPHPEDTTITFTVHFLKPKGHEEAISLPEQKR